MVACTGDGVVQFYDPRSVASPRTGASSRSKYTFTDDDDFAADSPMVCASGQFDVVDDQALVINWVAIAAAWVAPRRSSRTPLSQAAWCAVRWRRWRGGAGGTAVKTTKRDDLVHNEGQPFSREIANIFPCIPG